jgi:hypothetical protein
MPPPLPFAEEKLGQNQIDSSVKKLHSLKRPEKPIYNLQRKNPTDSMSLMPVKNQIPFGN